MMYPHKLIDLVSLVKNGVTPDKFDAIPYIGLEHIIPGEFLLNSIGSSSDVTSSKFLFKENDVLYGKIRPYFQKAYKPDFKGICSTDILVIRTKNDKKLNQDYLYQIIRSKAFTKAAISSSTGTKMPRADWNSLSCFEIHLPPISEQKAIAEVLSAIDDKIENNLAINKTLEDMAMALYKHWFVDFGPFKDGEFVDSELGLIPKGWEVKSIYDLAEYVNGAPFKSSDFSDEGLPVIKIAELKNGISANTKLSVKNVKEAQKITSGSILFSWSASLDVFLWTKGHGLLNQHVFNVLPNRGIPDSVLFFLLKHRINEFQKIAASRATTMGHIKVSHLKESMIAIPSPETLEKIERMFNPLFSLMRNSGVENETLFQLRKTLLPKLISGEVRLKEFRDQVEKAI